MGREQLIGRRRSIPEGERHPGMDKGRLIANACCYVGGGLIAKQCVEVQQLRRLVGNL